MFDHLHWICSAVSVPGAQLAGNLFGASLHGPNLFFPKVWVRVLEALDQVMTVQFRKHAIIHAGAHRVARRDGGYGSFHPILQRALAAFCGVAKDEVIGGIGG